MQNLIQELRYGFRMLRKHRSLALIAIITLALGIGANTAIFSVINAAIFRSLPYPDEASLVVLREQKIGEKIQFGNSASYLNFRDWQSQTKSFQHLAIVSPDESTLTGAGDPVRVKMAITSSDIFNVLQIQPMMGRGFNAEDDVAGKSEGLNNVVLSNEIWRQRFAADPQILGHRITLDNTEYNVIGVMPKGIFPLQKEPVDFWITVAIGGDANKKGTMNGSRGYRAYAAVLGRLKRDVSVSQAQSEMESLSRGLAEKYPDSNLNYSVNVMRLRELLVGSARSLLFLLLGIVGAVLLIACANVANLLLARATVRHREIAIRSVLGASQFQIIRQLLIESLLISFAGGVLGLLISLWGVDLLISLLPSDIPRITGLTPDWRVLLFTLGAVLVTGLLCGLAPALSVTRPDISDAMKEGGRSATGNTGKLRHSLIVGEIAIALILLVGAGLLLKSFWRLQQVDPGFDYRQVLTAKIVLPAERYKGAGKSRDFYNSLIEKIKYLPGVDQASIAQSIPFTGIDNGTNFDIVGRPFPKGQQQEARLRFIGLDYFQTIGIRKLAGRDFTARDDAKSSSVVILNEAFARQYFRGEDPIGKKLQLGWGGDEAKEIIGVVGNVRHRGLNDDARPEMYVPQSQFATLDMTLLVRTSIAPETLSQQIVNEVHKLDRELPVTDIKTLSQYRADTVAFPRFYTLLLGLFGGLALALTVIGLYGVISYSVSQRTNEIGIRMALGAEPQDILRMILRQGITLLSVGIGIGLVGSVALTRLLSSLLYEVSATDPSTFILVSLLLTAVALLASFLPAYRATKVDPIIALRYE